MISMKTKRARKCRYKAKREWWERIKKTLPWKTKGKSTKFYISEWFYLSVRRSKQCLWFYVWIILRTHFNNIIWMTNLWNSNICCSIGFGFIGGDVVIESPNKDISGEEKENRWSIMHIMYKKLQLSFISALVFWL